MLLVIIAHQMYSFRSPPLTPNLGMDFYSAKTASRRGPIAVCHECRYRAEVIFDSYYRGDSLPRTSHSFRRSVQG